MANQAMVCTPLLILLGTASLGVSQEKKIEEFPPEAVVHVQDQPGSEPKLTLIKGAFDAPPSDPAKGFKSFAMLTSGDVWLGVAVVPSAVLVLPDDEPSEEPGFGVGLMLMTYTKERKVEYRRWKGLSAKDDLGNQYKQIEFRNSTILRPKADVTRIYGVPLGTRDLIIFERSVPKAKHITFRLPGVNLGIPGNFEIKITRETTERTLSLTDDFSRKRSIK
ncbi:hypothetical protein J0H58_34335 [bacterium]|nr:hypothetical protein [bacterium]